MRSILGFCLCLAVLSTSFSVLGQRKPTRSGKPAAAVKVSAPGAQCNGGWSGVVTFRKSLSEANKRSGKNISVGTTTQESAREYKYAGRIVVDASQNPRQPTTRSQVSLNDTDQSFKRFQQMDRCHYDGKGTREQWSETTESRVENAFAEGPVDSFNLNVNEFDGTYSFSFRLPDAKGVLNTNTKVVAGGWCSPKNNEGSTHNRDVPIVADGIGESIDDLKIDPENPGVLSGTKSWDTSSASVKSFVYTVTWVFKKCPSPVEVTDIRFDEHPYPDHTAWKEIPEGTDTIDGNIVRIRAKVVNFSAETKFPTIKFHELVENWDLPESEKSIRLEAGEEKEIEVEWDTSGYAWRGKGFDAESNRRIKVEAIDEARVSQLTKPIIVSPRPVILAHGLWSNAAAWAGYEKFFEEGHSAYWKSYAVGADPSIARMNTGEKFGNTEQTNTIKKNANELRNQIEHVRKDLSAWHVDIVAHSMGGLIARRYIATMMPNNPLGKKPPVTKLIMLGTPNQGSPCAQLMYAAYASQGKRLWALWELIPHNVAKFNELYSDRRRVRFSALVGKAIPFTCQSPSWGDGVVTIGSARWMNYDWRYSNSLAHTDLTSRADFGAFVFPRLSIGPRGNHDPELLSARTETVESGGHGAYFQKASFTRKAKFDDSEGEMGDGAVDGLTFIKSVSLTGNQSTVIDIPAAAGSQSSVVFVAPSSVSATLTDAAGTILGKSTAGTAEAGQMFRTIAYQSSAPGSVLKLKLESRSASAAEIFVAAFSGDSGKQLSVSASAANAVRDVVVTAKATDKAVPVTGLAIKAQLSDNREFQLLDDGKSGDGAAGDGVYGAKISGMADGDYFIDARSEGPAPFVGGTGFSIGEQVKTKVEAKPKPARKR